MPQETLKDLLKQPARKLFVGALPSELPPMPAADDFAEWPDAQLDGIMAFLERRARRRQF